MTIFRFTHKKALSLLVVCMLVAMLTFELPVYAANTSGEQGAITDGNRQIAYIKGSTKNGSAKATSEKATTASLFSTTIMMEVTRYKTKKGKYKIKARIYRQGPAMKTNLTFRLLSKETGKKWKVEKKLEKLNFAKIKSRTVRLNVGSTRWWKANMKGTMPNSSGSMRKVNRSTTSEIRNRIGTIYPSWTCDLSSRTLKKPPTNLSKTGGTRSNTYRKKYKNWFKEKYPAANIFIVWSAYEIHHVTPVAYGGTDKIKNLIHLPKEFHRETVNKWWNKY